MSGVSQATSNGTTFDTTAANGTYYPSAPNCFTNTNGIYWFLAPSDDPDFGDPAPYWMITPNTNSPLVSNFWYYAQDPCADKSWNDFDGNSYAYLGLWST